MKRTLWCIFSLALIVALLLALNLPQSLAAFKNSESAGIIKGDLAPRAGIIKGDVSAGIIKGDMSAGIIKGDLAPST